MPEPTPVTMPDDAGQSGSKLVVFQNTFRALITTSNGSEYEAQLRPHHTDPNDPNSPIWYEGFALAKSTDRRAADKLIENAFAKDGTVPAHLPAGLNARPLQLKLNPYPEDKKRPDGKSPDYIGSLLTSEGFFTVFARKMDGKGGLLLAGSVAPHQPKAPAAEAVATAGEPRQPKGRVRQGAKPTEDPK